MTYWTIKFPKYFQDINFWSLNINTLLLVFISSFFLIIFSFMSNYGSRVSKNKLISYLSTFSISGYALPGIILAVAFITFISWFSDLLSSAFGFGGFKNVFIGSIWAYYSILCKIFSLSFNGINQIFKNK